MGVLKNGKWHADWYDTSSSGGEFVREDAAFRGWIGQKPGGGDGLPAEPGRYHLYVSFACPWAHRTVIFRELKALHDHVGLSVVDPDMLDQGWTFSSNFDLNRDPHCGVFRLHELYCIAKPDYTGRVTVPVLWDTHERAIVNNESADIIRIFNSAFDEITGNRLDYYPESYREEIDEINAFVYENVNNGVYRCGFATTQRAYETAFEQLFSALDKLEARLRTQRYLAGNRITEADWRLFTTLIRFDPVYVGHFKCNRQRISDFANLSNYLRDLYQHPGIAQTVYLDHIKTHYYYSHDMINPNRIIPVGPLLDLDAPHDRDRLGPREEADAAS